MLVRQTAASDGPLLGAIAARHATSDQAALSELLSCALSGIATLFGVVAYRRQPCPGSPRLLAALAVLSAPILATLLVALLLVAV
ncbi:hypothetical protein [Chitinolyticbacter meiyuanensis]|uniref:hypothetical protein n=1 Tax=Chitinolyticbacter meiyuanensis TaxID=682798 RepID=UPI0011E5F74D|nr:hypothetical protein [Chitinolyticbacter meiyuanensis]